MPNVTGPRRDLTERNKEIQRLRNEGLTLEAIGERFDLRKERVRRILIELTPEWRARIAANELRRED